MMTTEPPSPAMRTAAPAASVALPPSVAPPSLAARHARALYRPVPPVGYDDEGHPESDSATVESVTHQRLRAYAVGALEARYAEHPGFFAASDLGLLFERGNPAAVMAPDLLVSFGAGDRRRTFECKGGTASYASIPSCRRWFGTGRRVVSTPTLSWPP